MRRSEREVTDLKEIIKIISQCEVVRLGLVDNGQPYIVPLSFAFTEESGDITFFFHSAAAGRKMDLMKANPRVCFEMDCLLNISRNEVPCNWSAEYESIMGYGEILFINHDEDKKTAMDLIMRRYGYEGKLEYSPSAFSRTALYKLSVKEITAKRNIRKAG